jgi:hypothetical protein
MNAFDKARDQLDNMEGALTPGLIDLCRPRRYLPPPGYPHPRYHGALMGGRLESIIMVQPRLNKTQCDFLMTDWLLIENNVPFYAVGQDFISDLMLTDPPEGLRLSDLQWPHEALAVLLPFEFQMAYFGRIVPYVQMARYRGALRHPPACLRRLLPYGDFELGFNEKPDPNSIKGVTIGAEASPVTNTFLAGGSVFFEGIKALPGSNVVDYGGSSSMDATIQEFFRDAQFFDSTTWTDPEITPEEDIVLTNKIMAVAIQLLFAVSQLPETVEPALCLRPHREKKGGKVVKEALWQPPWLGRRYRSERQAALGGHHASPHLHPRRGHWRLQPHGPKLSLRTWKFIRPCMVGGHSPES